MFLAFGWDEDCRGHQSVLYIRQYSRRDRRTRLENILGTSESLLVGDKAGGAVTRSSGTLEYCRLKGIAIQTWSPLQKGFFDGVFLGDPEYAELNQVLDSLADKYNVPADAVAYAWLLRYPARMQVIIGTMNPKHIESASKATDFTLTREEWYELYRSAGNELP